MIESKEILHSRRNFVTGALLSACTLCEGIRPAKAQVALNMDRRSTCNFDAPLGPDPLFTFDSGTNPTPVLNRILRAIGYTTDRTIFTMRAANVRNAAVGIGPDQERLILYSEDFMRRIATQPDAAWIGLFILAHEVGHHLLFHTLDQVSTVDRRPLELEADRFAGRVIMLLGGSLDNAQAASRTTASEAGSSTHPPRSARLEAIAVGYGEAVPRQTEAPQSDSSRQNYLQRGLVGDWVGQYASGTRLSMNITMSNGVLAANLIVRLYKNGAVRTLLRERVNVSSSVDGRNLSVIVVGQSVEYISGDPGGMNNYQIDSLELNFDGTSLSGFWTDALHGGGISFTRRGN